jgi:hypothetical protein
MARGYWILLLLIPCFSFGQDRYAVIINEIMADPSPVAGLPNVEWIELKNRSSVPVNLQGWRVADQTGVSGPMPAFILKPDSLVIICTSSATSLLSVYGSCLAVSSFPSLDNDEDLISLKTAEGRVIHALQYDLTWYGNELKKQGGWSLEMKDDHYPCAGASNWAASIDDKGGTPGQFNSSHEVYSDIDAPIISNTRAVNPTTIIISFNEPVDSNAAVQTSHYSINNGISISKAIILPPLFNEVQLLLTAPLQQKLIYTLSSTGISDCNGNTSTVGQITRTGLPSAVGKGDIILNEILFNPGPGSYDYIEFYNLSNKIIDVSSLFIANRNISNQLASITRVITDTFYIFPGDYIVITEDGQSLRKNYLAKDEHAIIEMNTLPSYPDDKGAVILLDQQGSVIDEVDYKEDWHFKLLPDREGVSLERINAAAPSQDQLNWHSASSTSGYGTPGYRNSQQINANPSNAAITISPFVFSPDNDGHDDFLTIHYKMQESGYVATIIIYDANGRMIRALVRNSLLGIEGNWTWDGLGENHQVLSAGAYIVYAEYFNLTGRKMNFKCTVILARKL